MSKKNKPNKKKRIEHIYATTKSNVDHITVSVNPVTGEITFAEEMENTYSEISYERAKSPKVLTRIPQNKKAISFDAEPAIESNYDIILAVDTNTRQVDGVSVSYTGVVIPRRVSLPGAAGIIHGWKFYVPFCLEMINAKPPIENLCWIVSTQILERNGIIRSGMRIGTIVDSDLGNINLYNEYKKPIYDEIMLPEGVQLIYGSADIKNENIINKCLSVADSAATQCFSALASGKLAPNSTLSKSPYCEKFRVIEVDALEDSKI